MLHEQLEYVRQEFGRDAIAVIPYAQFDLRPVDFHGERDVPPLLGIFGRVGEDVADGLGQTGHIGFHPDRLIRHLHLQALFAFLDPRLGDLDGQIDEIAVTNVANGQTLTLDSGRSAPITPLAWRRGTTQLIYRDASGYVRIADLGCLASGCGANPLESGTTLLPADAADVQTDGTWVYYRSNETIAAVNLGCVGSDSCLNGVVTLGTNAAPQTSLDTAGSTLVYTAYTQNPNDPNDREVRVINLACLGGGSCAPQPVASGAVAGALSSDGRFAVVEQADGLNSLDLSSGAKTYLSDRGAALSGARWQP